MNKIKLLSIILLLSSTIGCSKGAVSSSSRSTIEKPTLVSVSSISEEEDEEINPNECMHEFEFVEKKNEYNIEKCKYCKTRAISQPFDKNKDKNEEINISKGAVYTWEFTLDQNIEAELQLYGSVNSIDINCNFYSDSNNLPSSSEDDSYESDSAHDGIARVKINMNGVDYKITERYYREMGIYSGYFYFTMCTGIKMNAGKNVLTFKADDNIRYHVTHKMDVRLLYVM